MQVLGQTSVNSIIKMKAKVLKNPKVNVNENPRYSITSFSKLINHFTERSIMGGEHVFVDGTVI